jgi:endonuclease III
MRKKTDLQKHAALVFDSLAKRWPNAHCELVHNTPFQLLIAVVLSAQTTDKAVNKALEPLLKSSPNFDAHDLIKMGQAKFYEVIKSIGLAPTKAKNAYGLSQCLVKSFGGEVPSGREDLESLPGVGRKTANVILNELFGEPTVAIDTHLARLSYRMGFSESPDNRLQIEKDLVAVIPKKHLQRAHHYLIFQGRYLCKARNPDCDNCVITKTCPKQGV